jgi:uncharacterized protein
MQLHGQRTVRVVNRSRDVVLAERADVAASPWRRMRGLLGRPPLGPGEGLVIVPCQGVHSLGMSYSIDVVHVDRLGIVRRVLREFGPRRIGPLVWRSHAVVELPAASAAVEVGDELAFEALESNRSAPSATRITEESWNS